MKNINTKVKLLVIMIFTISSFFTNIFCIYAIGWEKDNNGEFIYVDKNGSMVTNSVEHSNGKWFYLGDDGHIIKNTLIEDKSNGAIYYSYDDGHLAQNEVILVNFDTNANFAIDTTDYFYYFGANRKAKYKMNVKTGKKVDLKTKVEKVKTIKDLKTDEKKGLVKVDKNIYYFDENGEMIKNYLIQDVDGYTVYIGKDGKCVKGKKVLVNQNTPSNKIIENELIIEFSKSSGKKISELIIESDKDYDYGFDIDARIE